MTANDQLRAALDDVVTKITWRPDKTALVHDSEALNTLIGYIVMVTSQPAALETERGIVMPPQSGFYESPEHWVNTVPAALETERLRALVDEWESRRDRMAARRDEGHVWSEAASELRAAIEAGDTE